MTSPDPADEVAGVEGAGADEPGPVERDLGRAELLASSGVQNSFAASPLGSLLMIPLAKVLTLLRARLRRRS